MTVPARKNKIGPVVTIFIFPLPYLCFSSLYLLSCLSSSSFIPPCNTKTFQGRRLHSPAILYKSSSSGAYIAAFTIQQRTRKTLLLRFFSRSHSCRSPMTQVNTPSKVNIQMPEQMLYNNGESVVKKSSGLTRVRKGQSEKEYLSQRDAFWTTGPLVQNHTFVTQYVEDLFEHEIDSTDFSVTEQSKHNRETIMHGLERLYFQRQYEQCLKDIGKIKDNIQLHDPDLDLQAKKNRNIKRILSELDNMSEMCVQKLHLRNQEKLNSI